MVWSKVAGGVTEKVVRRRRMKGRLSSFSFAVCFFFFFFKKKKTLDLGWLALHLPVGACLEVRVRGMGESSVGVVSCGEFPPLWTKAHF